MSRQAMMIDEYRFGFIRIAGKQYTSDLKIVGGRVVPGWWRKSGHSVEIGDIGDILSASPEYLIIGSGSSGLMQVDKGLEEHLRECNIQMVREPTPKAIETFNLMWTEGKNVAAAFHLTC